MAEPTSAAPDETSPLFPTTFASPRSHRTVTFNPTVQTESPRELQSTQFLPATTTSTTTTRKANSQPSTPTQSQSKSTSLSAINSKLRCRRHSQSAVHPPPLLPKIGPQRTTKTAEKLKLLPDPAAEDGDEPGEESGRDVYVQYTRIKDPTARRDAARLGKEDRERLPRVTAYCTAQKYMMDDVVRWLRGKMKTRRANPKLFDECVYSPYQYTSGIEKGAAGSSAAQRGVEDLGVGTAHPPPSLGGEGRRFSDSAVEAEGELHRRGEAGNHRDLIDLHTEGAGDVTLETGESALMIPTHGPEDEHFLSARRDSIDFDTSVLIPEVFLFAYGTVVLWGFTVKEEGRFLKEISKFAVDKLAKDDVQSEDFNFYYTSQYQARIYNDFISLSDKKNYMVKLAISHALAQSVKTSLYEDLVDATIDTTKEIPSTIALTGKVNLSRKQINQQIGALFILRIDIHLTGSVLDAPELMWSEPQLEPVYSAVRSYLEMDQRVGLLTERLNVIGDLLAVLKDQLSHAHGEYLEWIVIVLIAAEILVAGINIVVDLVAGA